MRYQVRAIIKASKGPVSFLKKYYKLRMGDFSDLKYLFLKIK